MFNRNYLTGAKLLREKYLIICKCNKGKSPERFGDEDIYHFSVLAKELPQFISSHVLCTTPNKHLSVLRQMLTVQIPKKLKLAKKAAYSFIDNVSLGCDCPLLALAACHRRGKVCSRLSLFSPLFHARAWRCLRLSSSCGARGGFLPRHDEDLREPLVRRQGSQIFIYHAKSQP